MPQPSPLASTTAIPAGPPNTQPPSPPPGTRRRGNPNLALVPRCGARTRAGCPCRAPAIHGKLRCRMHGGRSTGPRTADGMARLRAARTTHGGYSAETRAFNRHHVTALGRSRVRMFTVLHFDRLPLELAARMTPLAPELRMPPRPTRGITRAEDRVLLRAEAEALAPWKQAIALDRQARRADRVARAIPAGARAAAQARPLAPEQAAGTATPGPAASPAAPAAALPEAHAPIPPPPAQPMPQPAPAGARAEPPARPDAPERTAPGLRGVPAPAGPAALSKAHAPIPSTPVQPAMAGVRTEPAAKPHTPIRGPKTGRVSRPIPVGRAARRWLRRQKRLPQNQPGTSR
jgi:hypothetical protein